MKVQKSLFVAVLTFVAIAVGWWYFCSGVKTGHIRHVLLISIDTCRADHLSCYGYPQKTTPNIDAIAQEGVLFENAYSPVPMTLPAHSSMLTGTIPPYHGIHDNFNYRLDDSNVTIAEILKSNGFATGAVVSTYVLDSHFGINQGFDTYNDKFIEERAGYNTGGLKGFKERKADKTTRIAIEWLEKHKNEPFFYFLHYYDPHTPYEPPEPFASRFHDSPYAGEIAFADHCVGQVIHKLKELDLYDSTLIIIAGDHGEMLGEHGEETHQYFIYQGAIRVPLILKLPGQQKTERIQDCVGLVDIVPTICSLLGIELQSQMHGQNLADYFVKARKKTAKDRYIYCESLTPTKYEANTLLGVVTNRYKYIQTTRPELYNIVSDPAESKNLVASESHRARIMQDKLKQILEEQTRKSNSNCQFELDADARRRLESLGYVSGGVTEDFSFDQTKKDPKDLIGFHELSSKAEALLLDGDLAKAQKLFDVLVKQNSDYFMGYVRLAKIARIQKDFDGAAVYLEKAGKIGPKTDTEYHNLGIELTEIGRNKEAIVYLKKALLLNPDKPEILTNLGLALLNTGDIDDCITYCKRALGIDPDSAEAHRTLGVALEQQGQLERAVKSFERSLQIEPDQFFVYNHLGSTLYKLKKPDQAIQYWAKSLRLNHNQAEVHNAMGSAFAQQGRFDESIAHFRESLRLKPAQPEILGLLSRAYICLGKTRQAIDCLEAALKLEPDESKYLNDLAWKLATALDEKVRDPEKAVRLADQACKLTKFQNPLYLDTLAAAYASSGKFVKAVDTAEKALQLAQHSNQMSLEQIDEFKERLERYRTGRPFYETHLDDK